MKECLTSVKELQLLLLKLPSENIDLLSLMNKNEPRTADLFIDMRKRILLEDWSRASPLDESKLWLLRREDIVGKEEGPWEGGLMGEARHGILGTLGMLGARIRLGMLLRSLSMQPYEQTRSGIVGVDSIWDFSFTVPTLKE